MMKTNAVASVDNLSTREAILNATEKIMQEEGYAAVTSRKVGSAAGLKSQLVYYYFKSMDDLFVAVIERCEARYFERLAAALISKQPIRSIWKLCTDSTRARLSLEFYALANHRKSVRAVVQRSTRQSHGLIEGALARIIHRPGFNEEAISTPVLSLLLAGTAFTLVTQAALGVSDGHAEMFDFVESRLQRIESQAEKRRRGGPQKTIER
jgi:AcrR family transcriptional regulator